MQIQVDKQDTAKLRVLVTLKRLDGYMPGWGLLVAILGAKTINVFRACLDAQLTICAQK